MPIVVNKKPISNIILSTPLFSELLDFKAHLERNIKTDSEINQERFSLSKIILNGAKRKVIIINLDEISGKFLSIYGK